MDVSKEKNVTIVGSVNEITVIQDNRISNVTKVNYEPSSVSISPDGHVAIGGSGDSKVHVFELNGTTLEPKTELTHLGAVTDVAYSPDGKYLVASDANRKLILYSVEENYKVRKIAKF